jgi:hypothetical protein
MFPENMPATGMLHLPVGMIPKQMIVFALCLAL